MTLLRYLLHRWSDQRKCGLHTASRGLQLDVEDVIALHGGCYRPAKLLMSKRLQSVVEAAPGQS